MTEISSLLSDEANSRCPDDGKVPLFSASELAPAYHDGATGSVLGCPHYARACKYLILGISLCSYRFFPFAHNILVI